MGLKCRREEPARFTPCSFQDWFPLAHLTPGSYVLTVEAKSADGKHGSMRQVPFTVAEE